MLGCWLKTGNLNEISEERDNRIMVFENTSPNQIIRELTIIRYMNNTFEITAQAKDDATYTLLKQATLEEGFDGKESYGFKLSVLTSRLGLIGALLKAFGNIEPEYGSIKNVVRDSINVAYNLPKVDLAEIVLKNPPIPILTGYSHNTVESPNNEGGQVQDKKSKLDSRIGSPKDESIAKKRK